MRAADALCEALKAEGVTHVFGIPGGANLPIYDALYDADFEHIQARHEQGGGHAAEGYARASGRVGARIGPKPAVRLVCSRDSTRPTVERGIRTPFFAQDDDPEVTDARR